MTDRDDFRGGYGGGIGSGAVLYGMPPMPRDLRGPDGIVPKGGFIATTPVAPATLGAAVESMKTRVRWLENELRQHDAWKHELETLYRMIAVYESPPNEGGGEP